MRGRSNNLQNSGSTQLEQPLLLAPVEISKKKRRLLGWGCTFDAPKSKVFKHLWIGLENESLKRELLYLVGLSPRTSVEIHACVKKSIASATMSL